MAQTRQGRQQDMNRRVFLKRSGWAALGFVAACALPFYSYFAEPRWIEIVKIELQFRRLPAAFDGVRIVHFSDVHYGFHYEKENLADLISTITALGGDIIVFTGDLFDGIVQPYARDCEQLLTRLNAPLGLYTVMGNHDYYTGSDQVVNVYENSGFQVLRNRSVQVKKNGQIISIAGVDDMLLGKPDLKRIFSESSPEAFTLFLAHEPDFAVRTTNRNIDLQLSGHSHGGQVRLPLVGEIVTPRGGKLFVKGLYEFDDRDTRLLLYTNRGIGMAHIPIRLLCRPEITIITLRSDA